MKTTFHIPPSRYADYALAEDVRLDDVVIPAGARLVDVFPDGITITKHPVFGTTVSDEVPFHVAPGSKVPEAYEEVRLKIDGPPYFEDDEVCGYCGRVPGEHHAKWCRQ
jgi:hypothetical protein